MIDSVSKVSGTSGNRNIGSVEAVRPYPHRAHIQTEHKDDCGQDHDADEGRRYGIREPRQKIDDGKAKRHQHIGEPRNAG